MVYAGIYHYSFYPRHQFTIFFISADVAEYFYHSIIINAGRRIRIVGISVAQLHHFFIAMLI
jgi:hypothetical protein